MASGVRMTVKGMKEVGQRLRAYPDNVLAEIEAELFEVGSEVEAEAKELVPVDSGYLRSTGFTIGQSLRDLSPGAAPSPEAIQRVIDEDTPLVVVGFSAVYALNVHENPRAGKTGGVSPRGKLYRTWARVGQWKFLETPMKRMVPKIRQRLQERLGKALRRRAVHVRRVGRG
jgi:hypothetical protein